MDYAVYRILGLEASLSKVGSEVHGIYADNAV